MDGHPPTHTHTGHGGLHLLVILLKLSQVHRVTDEVRQVDFFFCFFKCEQLKRRVI